VESVVNPESARDAQARLNAILEAAVDAIIVIDERGSIELFSAAAERMFGWTSEEVEGRNVSRIMPEPYRSAHDGNLDRYLRTGIPRIIGIGRELEAVHRNGRRFPVELTVGEIASFGESRRFVGLVRDISERRRVEEEARVLRDRLAHVGRLGAMGEMTAGIAHEINQPLTAIASYAQALGRLLEPGEDVTEEHRRVVERIAEQALRAGDVVQRLRQLARREGGDRSVRPPNRLVQDVLRLAEVDVLSRGLRLETDLAPDLPGVDVDEVQIQQVVLNLVRNAVDATVDAGGAGAIVVRTARAPGGPVEISVTDEGSGIPPEVRSQLFQPFFTTKRDGMGMGLSISRSIVEAHGGRLDCETADGRGATFLFTLPAASSEAGS
jgi:two-component system sensor kinase FixL